jgi:uncharacterized membrane protein
VLGVINPTWRKRFSLLQKRLYLYPAPEPMPRTRLFWLASGLVAVAVILFCSFFILYLTTRHDVVQTNAEDLGIVDQAIWNTVNGNMLHETVCNVLHDTNCSSSGVTRFAIHFEPILFLVSLFYLFAPDPKTLIILQTLVVASGAFPAFWLARLRLRSELAGVAIALLYLLYPGQQLATIFDFHAVTLTAAFLLFALYFMYTRRTVLLFLFAILAMACKEEVPLVLCMFGLWSMVFQRRWRSGLALVILSVAWLAVGYTLIMPAFSHTGKPLLSSRYDHLGSGPLQWVLYVLRHPRSVLKDHVFEHAHMVYLRSLFAPSAYLALLAPWILVLALPILALNMLSSYSLMYSGQFQYNAEIVPVLIFAVIEAMVLILSVVRTVLTALSGQTGNLHLLQITLPRVRLPIRFAQVALLTTMLGVLLFCVLRSDYYFHGNMPFSIGFQWPARTAHSDLAQRFFDMIPPDASVSAQSKLVPHISHRQQIYQFPYGVPLSYAVYARPEKSADYILLDVTGDIYPYYTTLEYVRDIKTLLLNGYYGVVAAQDGYLLLKRGIDAPGVSPLSSLRPAPFVNNALVMPDLPEEFCSYMYVSPQEVTHPMQATFTDSKGSVNLIGQSVNGSSPFSHSSGYMSVTTYWRVSKPMASPFQMIFFLRDQQGKEYYANNDVPALFWCQSHTWKPGAIVKVTSRLFHLKELPTPDGLAQMSVTLLPLEQPSSKMVDVEDRLPVQGSAGSNKSSAIAARSVELAPMIIVP